MTLSIPFDNTYWTLPERFYAQVPPRPAPEPRLLAFNQSLAEDLGIRGIGSKLEQARAFSGADIPAGARPLAQAYAGHQFGNFVPQLGDGRAVLLGEVVDRQGTRRDIQLKGSGQTPFSRGGDGRAWMGPVLREYVVSEAMHALGIPTTRALAAVGTGDFILRQEGRVPGAVLTRVAASHLRVGTFQYFAARQDTEALRTLLDYAIARHDPMASSPYDFFKGVMERQVDLISRWLGIGFIHGVMNTDNCSISGETIDYGPCAFMDRYHPATVFSSIDRYGRYAYANQSDTLVWNMAQLASSLVPLDPDQESAVRVYTEAVHRMPVMLDEAWMKVFRAKIGLTNARPGDRALIEALLSAMAEQQADFTNTFRGLADGSARNQFLDPTVFDRWAEGWRARLLGEPDPEAVMLKANPAFIPRNHQIEEMISRAISGDMGLFDRMIACYAHPFETQPDFMDLAKAPLPDEEVEATFCGT